MGKTILLTAIVCIQLLYTAGAQNLFGTWVGNQEFGFGWSRPDKIVLELNKETDSTFTGISHTYYGSKYYEHYRLEGTINKRTQQLIVKEVSTISVKIGFFSENYPGTYFMRYDCQDSICKITGYWKPLQYVFLVANRISATFYKKAVLPRPKPLAKDTVTLVPPKLPPPATKETARVTIPPLPNQVSERKEDIQSLIEIDPAAKDSVHIAIYDNGEIDNDTISLYFNNKLLVDKKMISLTPITLAIAQHDIIAFSKLKLFAVSLGTIPPCTATMIITIGKKRYEVSLSSDLSKNATVEFFLKE